MRMWNCCTATSTIFILRQVGPLAKSKDARVFIININRLYDSYGVALQWKTCIQVCDGAETVLFPYCAANCA